MKALVGYGQKLGSILEPGELVKCFKHGKGMSFVLTLVIFYIQNYLGVHPTYFTV